MEVSALRISTPDAVPAEQAAPVAARGPRIVADPLGRITTAQLVAAGMNERGVQRYAEALARNAETCGFVEKLGCKWHFSPLAPDPTALPDSGSTLRDYLFLRTGQVVRELLGVYIPETLAAQIPEWTERKRARFHSNCELARQYGEHETTFCSLPRGERDRLFRADEQRATFCAKHGITRWSARSVREWRQKVESGSDPDLRGRPRHDDEGQEQRCSTEAWDRFKVLFLDPRRRTVRVCWEIVAAEAEQREWHWPDYRTVCRRRERDLPDPIADFTRLGKRRWEAKHAPFIERDRQAQYRPFECWVSDHTRENFWSMHKGRWVRKWVTIWVDACTGLILSAVRSVSPNSDTILASFKAAVQKFGAPLHVVLDNGRDFRAKAVAGGRKRFNRERVEGVMGRLGIGVTFTEVYHGQSKGVCERIFGPMDERFWKLIPTYCGNSPANRPEDLSRELRDGTIAPTDEAEIEAAFQAWIETWNNTPREHLEKLTPVEAAKRNPIPRRTAPEEVLDELCLPEVERQVKRLGVNVRGLWFGQGEVRLLEMKDQTVRVRFDPLDASRVSVLDAEGRLIVHCYQQRLRGVDHDDIRVAKRRKKAAVRACKAAAEVCDDRLHTVASLAVQVAAQRRMAERRVEQRKAVGAECVAGDERGVALLPGAAEAQDAIRTLRGRGTASAAGQAARPNPADDAVDWLAVLSEQGPDEPDPETVRRREIERQNEELFRDDRPGSFLERLARRAAEDKSAERVEDAEEAEAEVDRQRRMRAYYERLGSEQGGSNAG